MILMAHDDHRDAELALRSANRRLNRARARRATADTPAARREWTRALRTAERDAATALHHYQLAEAARPVTTYTAA